MAKDESRYLTEWVHHYLYFGADKILVAFNRSTDPSENMAAILEGEQPQFEAVNVDSFDKIDGQNRKDLQRLAYAVCLDVIRKKHPDITHAFFVDIDEFWFPRDFKTKLNDFVDRFGDFASMSFNWVAQGFDDKAYSPPFSNRHGDLSTNKKTIIALKYWSKLTRIGFHDCAFSGPDCATLDGRGERIDLESIEERAVKAPEQYHALILHRMFRSAEEYFSILLRGRLSGAAEMNNGRTAQRLNAMQNGKFDLHQYCDQTDEISKYHKSLDAFFSASQTIETIHKQRESQTFWKLLPTVRKEILIRNFELLVSALKGTVLFEPFARHFASFDLSDQPIETKQQILNALHEIEQDNSSLGQD
ncbi:MAG: glycosyltransferase family 2 protein [Pseudomonadota bacterium]